MPEINNATQYYLFMKWFKNTHPRLYNQYKLYIKVPTKNYQIQAAMDCVALSDQAALQSAINEYYRTAPN